MHDPDTRSKNTAESARRFPDLPSAPPSLARGRRHPRRAAVVLALLLLAAGCGGASGAGSSGETGADGTPETTARDEIRPEPRFVDPEPGEEHFGRLRQLTFRGENAEAYFSDDETRLIFQASRRGGTGCDQMYVMNVDGSDLHRVSNGEGRTTCGYFYRDDERILYSSTHHLGPECPPAPDYTRGYVWALYDYDIYTARPDGSDLRTLFRSPGYDAEATLSPAGDRIVFTSTRDGDLEIYTMDPDGSDVHRLTHETGYDGGPFFGPEGERIVYRAYHPETEEEIADYRSLLEEDLVRPTTMEIFVMNADGSEKRQLTDNGAANFAPYFHPDGERIIFSSNMHDPEGRNFDLYMIRVDGTGLERITTHPDFDSFPMFSEDGSKLVFGSNRHAAEEGDTNVFVADWVETPAEGGTESR